MTTTDSPIPARRLGATGPEVFPLGLGAMGMSALYGPTDRDESIATVHAALDAGITLIDTGDFYGMGDNELLLADALRGVDRDRYLLSVKFGAQRDPAGAFIGFDSSPAALKTALAYSLRRLDVDHIDVYRPSRLDPRVPIEDTVGAVAEMIQAGYVRYLGLSEMGVDTIRRAHAVHPITALQTEYSLWSRDPEDEQLPTVRELGIGFVAYSPLGRGFLTGQLRRFEDLPADDWRRHRPRFQGENFRKNLELVDRVKEIAATKQVTPAQLALAWLLAQGEGLVPIPGTKRRKNLEENVAALGITLTREDLQRIDEAAPKGAASGERYEDMSAVNR